MAMRATRILRGPYSRMMDLGGVPAAQSSMRGLDTSKNCKVRVIAFDFELLTRSVVPITNGKLENDTASESPLWEDAPSTTSAVPTIVQEMANLLNVKLGGDHVKIADDNHDDLSALTGEIDKKPELQQTTTPSLKKYVSSDIRAKYADKLKSRGGLAGVESAKQEVANTLKGDAAGHMAARAAMVKSSTLGETKWMALTGTGTLLTYLSNRSMKMALLPIPKSLETAEAAKRMHDLVKQLPNIQFDMLVEKGDDANEILTRVVATLEVEPIVTMVVSDRDDYLRAAKHAGMVTCRIRPMNSPHGNVSAHYSVPHISDVQEVVNEINGISYQAVFAAGK